MKSIPRSDSKWSTGFLFTKLLLTSALCSCLLSQNATAQSVPSQKASEQEIKQFYDRIKKDNWQNLSGKSNQAQLNENPVSSAKAVEHSSAGGTLINCWDKAGEAYNIDPWLLFAYAKTESSFNPYAVNKNSNSQDIGLMQINSIWFPVLAKYNIQPHQLFDSCVSIYVGAFITRLNINKYGLNFYGLSAYNVGNPHNPKMTPIAQRYYSSLMKNYRELTARYRDPYLKVSQASN